jgi:diaminopimelate epimerase
MAGNNEFVKYQGLGNDFVIVDNLMSSTPKFTPEQAVKICDRNFGIGGDGLIFVLPGENGCDYTMRIYNSDGSEPQMCGNGIRCMARFVVDEIDKKAKGSDVTYTIWTKAGKIVPKVTKTGSITVDMGKPILQAEQVPTKLPATKDGAAVEAEIEAAGKKYKATCVSMGNPHSVSYRSYSAVCSTLWCAVVQLYISYWLLCAHTVLDTAHQWYLRTAYSFL